MSVLERAARLPVAAIETANIILTTDDAVLGATPKDVVWTHRKTTLYRYRSSRRRHEVPILLVFALINGAAIWDLRPGNSFVEYLLDEGFDVYSLDWGVPDDEDADQGLGYYVCDAIPWASREVLRGSGAEELSVIGWCIGGALSTMHCALEGRDSPVRNLVALTTPIDTTNSTYGTWVGGDHFDVDFITEASPGMPGRAVDVANKLLKPVTNFWTTYRRLAQNVYDQKIDRPAYQAMARWVADNPPFTAAAFREWITDMYKQNRLVAGTMRIRDRRVDLGRIEQNLLVVTAGADHIAPVPGTLPLLDLVSSGDVTHFDRPGGHIGLMAGSRAKATVWPDVAAWLAERSNA